MYDRYGSLGIRRLRTDESGAVLLAFGSRLEVSEYRAGRRRYWHGQ